MQWPGPTAASFAPLEAALADLVPTLVSYLKTILPPDGPLSRRVLLLRKRGAHSPLGLWHHALRFLNHRPFFSR